MNITDKYSYYDEIGRVLKSGGCLLFHDIFKGNEEFLYYPVPWAEDESINFLIHPDKAREILTDLGFSMLHWSDKSRESLDWFVSMLETFRQSGSPPLGTHLLMGENAGIKFENQIRSLREDRFVVRQALLSKDPQG